MTTVNNPTQINIGSTENSVQTVSRKVKEAVNNPQETAKVVTDITYLFWVNLWLGMGKILKIVCVPLIFWILGWIGFASMLGMPLSALWSPGLMRDLQGLWGMLSDLLFIKLLPFLPIVLALFASILWQAIVVSKIAFKYDKERQRRAQIAITNSLVLWYVVSLISGNGDKKS